MLRPIQAKLVCVMLLHCTARINESYQSSIRSMVLEIDISTWWCPSALAVFVNDVHIIHFSHP